MPPPTGDRFSSASMADCAFCPSDGRRFRTARQCSRCAKPLCLSCRPEVPEEPFICPECGGGPAENAIHEPALAIKKIEGLGRPVPFWLLTLHQRLLVTPAATADDLIAPE